MSNGFPMVPLGELLFKSEERIDIDPSKRYQQVTVKLWGKGVVLRSEVAGTDIGSPQQFIVKAKQFILSKIDARNGAFGLVPASLDGAVVSSDFPVFNPDNLRIIPEFLEWISKTHDFIELCKAASEGTTNRVRLKEDRFLASKIPLPSLEEQQHIVARIEELAGKIEEAQGLRQKVEEEAEVVIRVYAKKILSATNAELSEIRCWLDPKRDGVQTGPFGAQLNSNDFVDTGVPILTIGNIQYGGLKLDDLKHVSEQKAEQLARFSVKEGDILFARMGTVGRCCVVPREAEGWLFNYHIIRLALDRTRIDPRFVHWSILASTDIEEYLDEKIRGATRLGVNSAIVASLPIRVPSLSEQHHIVDHLDDLQARVDSLKQLQSRAQVELDFLLPSILDKAFKGEL